MEVKPRKCMRGKCEYYHKDTKCCEYILMEGSRRPCPPNACTVYKPAKTDKRRRMVTVDPQLWK